MQKASKLLYALRVALFLLAIPSGHASAELLDVCYTGSVTAIDPNLAASLPPDTPITTGAAMTVTYTFESTTPDTDPDPSSGIYLGAIVDFELTIGSQRFDHIPAGPLNEIDILVDSLLNLYQPVDSVSAGPALPGFPILEADVIFIAAQFGGPEPPLADDSLPIEAPSPTDPAWGDAKGAIYDDANTLLIEAELSAKCEGDNNDSPAVPIVGSGLLAGLLGALGAAAARRGIAAGRIRLSPTTTR